MRLSFTYLLLIILLAGCAAPASRWRDDAFSRFNSAVSAGSQQFAPEETDNIRQTLALAERYFSRQLIEEADRLYQLSCQKSQLLYRNLVLSKVSQGPLLPVQGEETKRPEEMEMVAVAAPAPVREINGAVQQNQISQNSCSSAITCNETPDIEAVPDKPAFERIALVASPAIVAQSTVSNAPMETAHEIAPAATKPSLEHLPGFEQPGNPVPVTPQTAHSQSSAGQLAKKISRPGGTATRTESGRPTIYLTFDDGPSRLTLPIASYLNSQGITATFFVLGNNVKGHEKAIRDTVALGHRVGNHTQTHDLKKLNSSLQQGTNEIVRTSALIEKLGGDGRMVRIPYGASSKALTSAVTSGGGQIFDWDINSLDSSKRGAKDHAFIEREVTQQLQKNNKRNIILLFHDGAGHDATLVAIRNLIPKLKQEGYRFGLLSRTDCVAQSRVERN